MTITINHKPHVVNNILELEQFIIKYKVINNLKCLSNIDTSEIFKFERISLKNLKSLLKKDFKSKSNRQTIYWIERGFCKDDAERIVFELQSNSGKKGGDILTNDKRNTHIDFYIAKGLSIDEAKKALSNRQATFSKKTLIKKYGIDIGLKLLEERNTKWLNKLNILDPVKLIHSRISWQKDTNKVMIAQKRRKEKMIALKYWVSDDMIEDFKLYHRLVWKYTEKNINSVENIELRSKNYHLDHKFSISEGFKNHILPYYLGQSHNLEILPASINCSKNFKCSISIDYLLTKN